LETGWLLKGNISCQLSNSCCATYTTGATVAEAFHHLYFFERTAEVQVLAQSTGQMIREVPKDIVDLTVEQFKDSTHLNGYSRIDLHFAALKRMLDRSQPDYAA